MSTSTNQLEQNPQTSRRIILFLSGHSPHSNRARENLRRMLEKLELLDVPIKTIDMQASPHAATGYAVFAAPAIMKISPRGSDMLYGDLSNTEILESFLLDLAEI
ncbi:MAG: circadian clock KaiB family protein [Gammaproteobacteria bacterium]|nr:circadian clock KaiB family protein [Gammaproteobacteria bacterium]